MTALMTVDEVAAKLRLKRSTIFKLSSRGMIPRVKLGGALRFDPSEIDRWVEGKKQEAKKGEDCESISR